MEKKKKFTVQKKIITLNSAFYIFYSSFLHVDYDKVSVQLIISKGWLHWVRVMKVSIIEQEVQTASYPSIGATVTELESKPINSNTYYSMLFSGASDMTNWEPAMGSYPRRTRQNSELPISLWQRSGDQFSNTLPRNLLLEKSQSTLRKK